MFRHISNKKSKINPLRYNFSKSAKIWNNQQQ